MPQPDPEAKPVPEAKPDPESVAEQVFAALVDPTRRAILAALATEGPATATDLAERLPITRQAIAKHLALLAETGLVAAEPGERRRVRYRVHSAPMRIAQQFLAALARDWDSPLDALRAHLDGPAPDQRHDESLSRSVARERRRKERTVNDERSPHRDP